MAFSSTSYFAGIGTAAVAIALGFAGGAMVTTSAVQTPNRLERVTSNAPLPSSPSSNSAAEQANNATKDQPGVTTLQSSTPPAATAAAPSQAAGSQPAQPPAPVGPVVAKSDATSKNDTTTTNVRPKPMPPPSVKNEDAASTKDAAPSKNERAGVRSSDSRRETYRRRGEDRRLDDRRLLERKRRQDLEEATNTVRQMPRDGAAEQVIVDRDEPPPRIVERRPRLGLFGSEDDSPRPAQAPLPFGLFGDN
jgi:hypothetical protein